MKKLIFTMALLSMSATSFAALYSSTDSQNDCTLYRVVNAKTPIQAKENEVLINKNEIYGLSFQDLSIDFDNREAQVKVIANVVLGANRQVGDSKAIIPAERKDFNALINQVNRKINLLEKVCISADNKIAYVKHIETN